MCSLTRAIELWLYHYLFHWYVTAASAQFVYVSRGLELLLLRRGKERASLD